MLLFILPEGYDLIAVLRLNNVCLYYEVTEAIMLTDIHSFKLVLNVPLKSMNRQYNLYRMVHYRRVFQIILLFNLRLKKIILVLICCKEFT
jgi:hypothetical protein